ncbi:MAG: ribosomal protein S18-alanine N-acetyltransferase [Anaerolineales bacterium]
MSAAREKEKFRLRAMRSADIKQVHVLEERIFPTPWSLNSYQFELERNPASEQWVIETLTENEVWQVVAYSVCWLLGDEVHIANIAVDPDFRRQGFGRRLLVHILARAAQDSFESATLEVRSGNQAAQALYTSFGFHVVGRRKRYYRDNNEDALLMQLPHLDRSIAQFVQNVSVEEN